MGHSVGDGLIVIALAAVGIASDRGCTASRSTTRSSREFVTRRRISATTCWLPCRPRTVAQTISCRRRTGGAR